MAAVHDSLLVRLPIAHREVVRYDPGTGLEIAEQVGAKAQVYVRQKIKGNHRGRVDVGFENIVYLELHQRVDTRFPRLCARFLDTLRIDLDSDAMRAVLPGG